MGENAMKIAMMNMKIRKIASVGFTKYIDWHFTNIDL